jgi:hypothetical protein
LQKRTASIPKLLADTADRSHRRCGDALPALLAAIVEASDTIPAIDQARIMPLQEVVASGNRRRQSTQLFARLSAIG